MAETDMPSKAQAVLLQYLREAGDWANPFMTGALKTHEPLRKAAENRWVDHKMNEQWDPDTGWDSKWKITPAGLEALERFEKRTMRRKKTNSRGGQDKVLDLGDDVYQFRGYMIELYQPGRREWAAEVQPPEGREFIVRAPTKKDALLVAIHEVKMATEPEYKKQHSIGNPRGKSQFPKPKFKIGDRVVDVDGSREGVVSYVGAYDDYLGQYRYRVLESGGTRNYWNEGSMRKVSRRSKSNPRGKHISCGSLSDKKCRQLQHVYESARSRGFSKKRAAKQAWGAVGGREYNMRKSNISYGRPYGPGKFDTMLDAAIYQISMDGVDEESGDVSYGGWYGVMSDGKDIADAIVREKLDVTQEELRALRTAGAGGVILTETSDGFVYVNYYKTKKALDKAWEELLADEPQYEENPFRIGEQDKKVIRAFVDKREKDGFKLTTDGRTLDGSWMGGSSIAGWSGGKIHFTDTGSRAAQTVQNAIRREAAPNDIAPKDRRNNPQQKLPIKQLKSFLSR